MSLEKSLRLYLRRLAKQAVAQKEEKLNAQEVYEFSVAGSLQFDPSFFKGFTNDPVDVSAD
jgi:hypothetical protein